MAVEVTAKTRRRLDRQRIQDTAMQLLASGAWQSGILFSLAAGTAGKTNGSGGALWPH